MAILHLRFRPSLAVAQSKNPRISSAIPVVLLNRLNQIQPNPERNFDPVILEQALS